MLFFGTRHYNLEMIITVGYHVRSSQGYHLDDEQKDVILCR